MPDQPAPPPAAVWTRCIDVVGGEQCQGVRASGYGRCLACLPDDQFQQFIDVFAPGSRLDLRGVRVGAERLRLILETASHRLGQALFDRARFEPGASFDGCTFTTSPSFERAVFHGRIGFRRTTFKDGAGFRHSTWEGPAEFHQASFGATPDFTDAQFLAPAAFAAITAGRITFTRAWFGDGVDFSGATLSEYPGLTGAVVAGDASLDRCAIDGTGPMGPFVVGGALSFASATFAKPVRVIAAAASVVLHDAALAQGGLLLLRHADVRLDRMTTEERLTVMGHDIALDAEESVIAAGQRRDGRPSLVSMPQVDCDGLALVDVDLSRCRFAGAFHLDKLGLEGRCTFAPRPRGGWRAARHVAAEEIAFRARDSKPWQELAGSLGLRDEDALQPQRLTSIYRQLRKALEDAKDEPGAGDFYYAEMDMRRRDRDRSRTERAILLLYWLIGGYGLRAWRPLTALAAAVVAAAFAFTAWPATGTATPAVATVPAAVASAPASTAPSPAPSAGVSPSTSGPAPSPAPVTVAAPAGTPAGSPQPATWAGGLRLALESSLSLLRTPATPVSDRGAWVQLALRFVGPVLLAMALLGIRNRVKR